jgi:hypothetical protein
LVHWDGEHVEELRSLPMLTNVTVFCEGDVPLAAAKALRSLPLTSLEIRFERVSNDMLYDSDEFDDEQGEDDGSERGSERSPVEPKEPQKEPNCREYEGLTDEVLRELSGLTGLAQLSLGGCLFVSDAGMKHFQSFPNPTQLRLSHSTRDARPPMTDVGLRELCSLTKLTSFERRSCDNVTGAGLAQLTALLTALELGVCGKVTNAGLLELLKLPALTLLALALLVLLRAASASSAAGTCMGGGRRWA